MQTALVTASIWKPITEWMSAHPTFIWSMVGLSVVTFVASLVFIPILVVKMPADYFMPTNTAGDTWVGRHPLSARALLVLKNLLGVLLVLAGIAMLVLPGQGVLTILIGISIMNFPGKRALELRIIRIPAVHRGIDWMRERYHHSPLQLPEDDA